MGAPHGATARAVARTALVGPRAGHHAAAVELRRGAAVALLLVGLLLALWPVPADRTRYELELRAGGQPPAQLAARWADPLQRAALERRPLCGPPVLAPLTYTQDGALRAGCAGPNARSASLAVLVLLAAAVLALRGREPVRREPLAAPA